jgi:hypothetical protein
MRSKKTIRRRPAVSSSEEVNEQLKQLADENAALKKLLERVDSPAFCNKVEEDELVSGKEKDDQMRSSES